MADLDINLLYYYVLRQEARKRVQDALNSRILRHGGLATFDNLTICSIMSHEMPSALDFARTEWPKHYQRGSWTGFGTSWDDIVIPALKDPDIFDLAIWQRIDGEQVLAALALGVPSNRRTHLTLKWVERFRGHTHIKGKTLSIVLACAEEYAKLLGSERVLVKDPLVPQLYERYGYRSYRHPEVPHGGSYMSKELAHG
ncbi:hypothetical protein KUV28_16885 [Ferrimonas balearica]|nr:hypothetical protein [Ferrimonas balearica]